MAILTASDKVSATVEFITGIKSGQFGEYRSVLFIRNDKPATSDEAKVWRSFQPHEVNVFRKGQRVCLIPVTRKDKQTWDVELIDGQQPTTTPNPSPAKTTEDRKSEIEQYVSKMARLYSFCYGQALASLPDCPESAVQAAASSVFIATQRKFNLT